MPEPDSVTIPIKSVSIDREGTTEFPLKSKQEVAQDIIDRLVHQLVKP